MDVPPMFTLNIKRRIFKMDVSEFKKNMRLTIATPFYNIQGFAPYITSLMSTLVWLKEQGIFVDMYAIAGEAYVDNARNKLADMFLKSDYTDMIFIDSDLQWDLDSFARLLVADADVVGGTYLLKNETGKYPCSILTDNDNYEIHDGFAGPPLVNEKGLIHARVCPTGFMKIRHSVFEKMAVKYPDNYYIDHNTNERVNNPFGRMLIDHKYLGEDVSFCSRWNAMGGQIFIEPRCKLTHWGSKGWEGCYHDFLMSTPRAIRKQEISATIEQVQNVSDRMDKISESLNKIIVNPVLNAADAVVCA
jgi:hypothetical protein